MPGGTPDDKHTDRSLDPDLWGPPFWDMLFVAAFHAKPTDSEKLFKLLQLLDYVIPCTDCRKSYMMFRQNEVPIPVAAHSDAMWAAKWLWTVHDYVNQKLNKPCISFQVLQKRHVSMCVILHDLLLFDLFVAMYWAIKPARTARVDEFVNLLLEIMRGVSESKLPTMLDTRENAISSVNENLYRTHEALFEYYGKAPMSVAEFHCKYDNLLTF